MANFASRLRDLRKQNKITQAELAQKLSIGGFEFSPSTVGMWEQGRRTPQLDTIDLIADFFNVDISYLTGSSDTTTRINPDTFQAEQVNPIGLWTSKPKLTDKDHKDIEKFINNMANELSAAEGLMFDGEPASDEDVESIINAMRVGVEMVKLKNKEKYTPKKYRK